MTQPEARADWQLPHDSVKTDLLLLLYTICSIADGVGGGRHYESRIENRSVVCAVSVKRNSPLLFQLDLRRISDTFITTR